MRLPAKAKAPKVVPTYLKQGAVPQVTLALKTLPAKPLITLPELTLVVPVQTAPPVEVSGAPVSGAREVSGVPVYKKALPKKFMLGGI